ncbi:hypothetical protein Cgig2_015592 [Carnegiea gigantea]|uniref:BHLH domain-containing protein n=1 Tax=Carnegiea gigantea TaxID=171969 RepID=A0A9Q1JXB9_9CARY|nr:hypothetical protein Cgig2_015592 [Carnegiea gigantea]
MAAFYSAFLADSVFSPNNDPVKNPGFLDEFFPDLDQFYTHQPLFHQVGACVNTAANERSCCIEPQSNSDDTLPLVTQKQRTESFTSSISMAEKADSGEQVTQLMVPLDKKRKSHYGSSSNSANSKEVKQVKWKKQKGSKEATKGVKNDKGDEQARKEPPEGYIHVRAKRGQATDSHSLAERARREKISQKMKTLQALVPGCDKVTGKALMLDEIINYVQSLQIQVELASLDPMVYIFGLMNHDVMMPGIEDMNNRMALPVQSASHSNISSPANSSPTFSNTNITPNPTIATTAAAAAAAAAFASIVVDSSTSLFQEQKPIVPLQDARSSYWGLDDVQQQSNTINSQITFGANNNFLHSFQ